jgi:hypothetical protein
MVSARSNTRPAESASGDRRWLVLAALVGLAGIAALAWALWPRENKLADLTAMQQEFLSAGGKPSSSDIRRVIATADRMSRDELRSAYRAAFEQWQGIREESIEATLAATGAERSRLLDEYLDRMQAFGELLQAMNPQAAPNSGGFFPGRRRGPPGGGQGRGEQRPDAPAPDSPEAKAEQARREMAARFDEFVAARAKERGIELPGPRR